MNNLRQAAEQALVVMGINQYTVAELAPHKVVMQFNDAMSALTAALRAALAEPEQEPVAWWHRNSDTFTSGNLISNFDEWTPLYTVPPQQQSDPLIAEQRLDIVATALRGHASTRDAIQWAIEAVERHHGIKE